MRSPLILALVLATVPATAFAGHGHGRGHQRYEPPPPDGRVTVDNRSGTTVDVVLSGGASLRLSPWQKATLSAPAGERTLRATYEQFGDTHVLESERLWLEPGRGRYVVLEPEKVARVMVTNDTPWEATLDVEDRHAATFRPHESKIIQVPLGDVELELHANGRELEETHLDTRAYAEHRWTVCREATGTFVAVNPFRERIEFVDTRGAVRVAEAYGRVVYTDVPAGSFRITARRLTDEPIDSDVVSVAPGRTVEWRPDAPHQGYVSVDNDHGRGVRLVVDGQTVDTLRPDEDTRLALDVGWHRVAARDEAGRLLVDTWVEVEPFDVARLRFGESGYVADNDHEHRHDSSCHHGH